VRGSKWRSGGGIGPQKYFTNPRLGRSFDGKGPAQPGVQKLQASRNRTILKSSSEFTRLEEVDRKEKGEGNRKEGDGGARKQSMRVSSLGGNTTGKKPNREEMTSIVGGRIGGGISILCPCYGGGGGG